MRLLDKESLLERLQGLDRDAALMFDDEGKYHVVIVGGGALILMGYASHATRDIATFYSPTTNTSGGTGCIPTLG